MAAARSTKNLKVIIVNTDDDDEDNYKADDVTSSDDKPMKPMRAPIKRKFFSKKAPIAKATSYKATKL